MALLSSRHCKPCEGGVEPLLRDEATRLLGQLSPEWSMSDNGLEIHRDFEFKGFYQTMAFVNAVAWIANAQGHHPDLEVGYGHCFVRYTTHAINGLSENDFICAARVDGLFSD